MKNGEGGENKGSINRMLYSAHREKGVHCDRPNGYGHSRRHRPRFLDQAEQAFAPHVQQGSALDELDDEGATASDGICGPVPLLGQLVTVVARVAE